LFICNSSSGLLHDPSISVEIPNATSTKLDYAGELFGMYFYTKKKGIFLEQNYMLVFVDIPTFSFRVIRETETPNVKFCHRQPHYLMKTGMFASSWIIRSFYAEEIENPVTLNLTGVSFDDSLLIFKDEKLFILRKGRKEWREMTDNVVLIQNPDLDEKCVS
ncbi:hypothetical protein PENTCL1PPCAC_11114, partial [Pristionchus entomophagus]